MGTIKKFRAGDKIPENAKYLYTREERTGKYSTYDRINESDPLNYIPLIGNLFGTYRQTTVYETEPVMYYEVDEE